MKEDLGLLQLKIEEIESIKQEIQEICDKLGGALTIVYDSCFVSNIEKVRDLLQEYVWQPRSSFEPEKLVHLVDELSHDRRGLGLEHEWVNLYWNIASILTEAVPFASLPSSLANLT